MLRHCRESLPDYMVPALFVTLEALPVSPNGKVDRAALPRPGTDRPDLGGYVPPRGHVQRELAGIWTALLGLDRVGAHDHFFDVGGHSLLASRLLARVRKTFSCEVPLADFLTEPTVAALAELVQDRLAAASSAVAPVRPALARAAHNGTVPVSLGQRRLWFVDRLAGVRGSTGWCWRCVWWAGWTWIGWWGRWRGWWRGRRRCGVGSWRWTGSR
nr:hypothetical protein GCM10020093_034250 [Planobispora longispora]